MMHSIHFLSEALKDVPTSLCNYQLAATEAVCVIFSNWRTVESSPTVPPTAVPNPPKPIVPLPKSSPLCYSAPTSKGAHGKYRITTSKGDLIQLTPVIPKDRQVTVNYKGDQEPIAACTRSQVAYSPKLLPFKAIQPLYEPVSARTRSRTLAHNYTTTSRSKSLVAQILTHAA